MAKRKAPARRRSGAAAGRRAGAAAARAVTPKRRTAARKVAVRKATARKTGRKAAKARPAAKRSTKQAAVKRAAQKARAPIIRRVVKTAAPKAAARKPAKTAVKLVKKAVAKPSPAPARAVAPKPKLVAAASAGKKKHALGLDRERRVVGADDDIVSPTPPSSLNLDRSASSARSGRQELRERYDKHTETSPALTGGDVDADWESAYSTGDEAPGGDNPTPDQNNVDDIGLALGVEYEDNEELEGADKIVERDRHRWEDDPASSEDFDER
jgi:hypothetical protein